MEDHVHLLARLKPTMAIADAARLVKANSSKWLDEGVVSDRFAWQAGYGAFTVGTSMVGDVSRYIRNQAHHHRTRTFREELIELLELNEIDYGPCSRCLLRSRRRGAMAVGKRREAVGRPFSMGSAMAAAVRSGFESTSFEHPLELEVAQPVAAVLDVEDVTLRKERIISRCSCTGTQTSAAVSSNPFTGSFVRARVFRTSRAGLKRTPFRTS